MANNYQDTSSFLKLDEKHIEQAKVVIERCQQELMDDPDYGYCGVEAEVEKDGVWLYSEEWVNTDHLQYVARALLDEFEIDEPFIASWSYTCSKPRIDEFGGGAMVVQRGYETYWCDAMCSAQEAVRDKTLTKLEAEPSSASELCGDIIQAATVIKNNDCGDLDHLVADLRYAMVMLDRVKKRALK